MTIRPIGPRIYVRPDPAPTETASGFLLPQTSEIPQMSGVVIAVGSGPASHSVKVRTRATAIKDCIDVVQQYEDMFQHPASLQLVREELARILRTVPEPEHIVQVGQRVIFPHNRGHLLVLDEQTNEAFIVLNEDDVIGVIEQGAEVAA